MVSKHFFVPIGPLAYLHSIHVAIAFNVFGNASNYPMCAVISVFKILAAQYTFTLIKIILAVCGMR